MKNRTELIAADLYVLLQREFRRRQDPACKTCFMQLPFRVDRANRDSPNWEVIVPPTCERGCRELIVELAGEYGALYDLRPETSRTLG